MTDQHELNWSRVNDLHDRAYDMYPLKHKPSEYAKGECFPMYSYERAATIFWCAFIEELVDRGLSDEEVEWLLRSKHMRWMFDQRESELEVCAKSLVTDSLIAAAKEK